MRHHAAFVTPAPDTHASYPTPRSSVLRLPRHRINKNVFLCVNPDGKAITLKDAITKKELHKYIK